MPTHVETPHLSVAVAITGPADGRPVMLLHGWPDCAATWNDVARALAEAGHRVIVPTLRGYKGARFRRPDAPRTGQPVALGRDAIELADALGLARFTLVGHDWGGRAVFPAAVLAPERLESIVSISVPWWPRSVGPGLSLRQAQAFWYQWFLGSVPGEEMLRADPVGFSRRMWETWSPPGWFTEASWAEVVDAIQTPDYVDVVLHFYRSRWGAAALDPAYAADEARFANAEQIGVPTLVIHGTADTCTLPALTEGMAPHFTARFERRLVPGAGHFPQREAPDVVAQILLDWLSETAQSL